MNKLLSVGSKKQDIFIDLSKDAPNRLTKEAIENIEDGKFNEATILPLLKLKGYASRNRDGIMELTEYGHNILNILCS